MKLRWPGARGQALPEAMLTLPLLVFIGLSLLQLAWVYWQRVLMQHAAQSAARAYTVWLPLDADEAQSRAQKAAQMALGPSWTGQDLTLDIQAGEARHAQPGNDGQLGIHQLCLKATVLVPGPLGRRWSLEADTAILREDDLPDVTDSSS